MTMHERNYRNESDILEQIIEENRRKSLLHKTTYTREEVIDILYKTYIKFRNCAGGEGYFKIDGKEYNTDTGYALEGMEILINHIDHVVFGREQNNETEYKENGIPR